MPERKANSRIAAIQLQRPNDCLRVWAEAAPDAWRDHGDRLNNGHERFDLALKRRYLDRYLDHLCAQLERAGEAGCDLVLLPETCLPVGPPEPATREVLRELCAWVEPRFLERTAPIARRHRMLIASCYYRAEGDTLTNDAVLMDERGEVAGIYHKTHLPCPLAWPMTEAGVFDAGDDYPVFETSLGRIGFLICYDIDFPEPAMCLALNGAELLLHPTVGYNFPDEEEVVGEARLRTRATDASVPLVYANFGPAPGRSAVYSASGAQLACAGRGVDQLLFADLDLRAPRLQRWGYETHDHRAQLARKRRPDTYGVLVEREPPFLRRARRPGESRYEYRPGVGLEENGS